MQRVTVSYKAAIIVTVVTFLMHLTGKNLSEEKKFKYVGAEVCGMCHSGEESGNQQEIWGESRHSKAFVTLASDRAFEQAQDAGIQGHPQKAPECLKCHIAGAGLDSTYFEDTYNKEEGVSCERCHGPGSDYIDIEVMEDRELFLANGGIIPDEKTCLKCHGDPFFSFEEKLREIAHPYPKNK